MHLVGATSNLGCSVDSCYLPCEYELLDIVIFFKKIIRCSDTTISSEKLELNSA